MYISMVRIPNKIFVSKGSGDAVSNQVFKAMRNQARGEGLTIARLFHRTTATWNHKPEFHIEVVNTQLGFEVSVWTDDRIYHYLDEGTNVRYAKMTDDFEPKTTPGFIGSVPGKGGLAYVDPNHPRPGIVAREFTDTIYGMRTPVYERNAQRTFTNSIVASMIAMGLGKA